VLHSDDSFNKFSFYLKFTVSLVNEFLSQHMEARKTDMRIVVTQCRLQNSMIVIWCKFKLRLVVQYIDNRSKPVEHGISGWSHMGGWIKRPSGLWRCVCSEASLSVGPWIDVIRIGRVLRRRRCIVFSVHVRDQVGLRDRPQCLWTLQNVTSDSSVLDL